jgi:hypothetical protein
MQKIIFLSALSIIFSFNVIAQKKQPSVPPPQLPIDNITKKIIYQDVVEVKGATADKLYRRALGWFRGYYKNPTEVIRENDSVQKKIVGKPRFRISNPPDKEGTKTEAGVIQYSITVAAREGRFKYEITEFNWKQVSNYPCERWYDTALPSYTKVYDEYIRQTDMNIQTIIGDLKNAMMNEKGAKKDDW